jgi:hypothetical protein
MTTNPPVQKILQGILNIESESKENHERAGRPLANLTKVRREKTQISKIRNAKGEITNMTVIQEIIRNDFEKLYSNKFEHLEEMDRFQDTFDHPKLNQEDINS